MNSNSIVLKSLIAFSHPILMLLTLGGLFYALYLGWQVRRSRTVDKEERKELIKGKFNQRHYQLGATLLVFWIVGGIGGISATYILYNKLFVSPHLILGLVLMVVVAMAAALAPLMQQGKDWARLTHIVLTVSLLGLVLTQTYTGIPIVLKMFNEILGNA